MLDSLRLHHHFTQLYDVIREKNSIRDVTDIPDSKRPSDISDRIVVVSPMYKNIRTHGLPKRD